MDDAVRIWQVVGGADKGGVLVRTGEDVGSDQCDERISTGAHVKEIALRGDRLQYERLSGTGPATGWVSIRLPGKDLLVVSQKVWKVTGGAASGGILVREGQDTTSAACGERLSTGALILELEPLQGVRLHYQRLTGSGPSTGWVSYQLDSGKIIVVKQEFPDVGQTNGAAAEAPASAKDSSSYESYPLWVREAAEVASQFKKGVPYLPPPEKRPARLEGADAIKYPIAPFIKMNGKQLQEVYHKNLPGCIFGIEIPNTVEQIKAYGADWLTKVFHAAKTLPADNKVKRIVRCEELPTKGFDTAGGAAMKAFLDVEYLKSDPELHTELFIKYPYDFHFSPTRKMLSTERDNDGPEVVVALFFNSPVPVSHAEDVLCGHLS
eukprot:gnl/TRDRNA2_/TRDRNA2_168405_c0_seq1.p2 gnl/TRDRNA2_/TRDRNA2_168405_c0~~gnl/TRDRNA2_/TRDRNA2_168405_c0_seq1.p2  ORF type:complete len:380 (-),score=65.62 gnl/TRDRNA2_/TRDRNA2_168405_c0_seq1:1066-2205(-)